MICEARGGLGMSAPVLLNASKTGSRAAIDVTKKAGNGPAGTHFY